MSDTDPTKALLNAEYVAPLGPPREVFNPETKQFERNPEPGDDNGAMTEYAPLRPYVVKLLEIAEDLADDVRCFADPLAVDVRIHLEALAEWKRQFDGEA